MHRMLTAIPRQVRADATALILFLGEPGLAVTFTAVPSGTILGAQTVTDAQGRAFAVYVPGDVGDLVTIQAEYGS